jgi:hypothetical protein
MMKRTENESLTVWILTALISFVSALVLPYVEGRMNSVWVVPPLLPAIAVPLLLLFASCLALLRCWIRSVRARQGGAGGGWFFLSLVLFAAAILMPRADVFQRGLAHYAKTVLTAEEWRGIARFAQERLPAQGMLPGPGKNLWNETEHRALWTELSAATPIQKLEPALVILVRPDRTEIMWGGALAGHRGIMIFNGKKGEDANSRRSQARFIADDIATFIGH